VRRPTPGIESLVASNVAGYSERLGALLERVHAIGSRPLCVTQPHRFYMRAGAVLRGLPAVFEYDGKVYNGLDYHISKVALDETMERMCTRAGGEFINMKARRFEPGDFYDPVHMTPAGARRLGDYLYEELERRGLFDGI
jgi:hypothetical protein